jgi:hypothetical protein
MGTAGYFRRSLSAIQDDEEREGTKALLPIGVETLIGLLRHTEKPPPRFRGARVTGHVPAPVGLADAQRAAVTAGELIAKIAGSPTGSMRSRQLGTVTPMAGPSSSWR